MPEAAAAARDGGTTAAQTVPNGIEAIYHVRVTQTWPLEQGVSSATAVSQERARFSFFGLELELMGFQARTIGSSVSMTYPLQFTTPASVNHAVEETQLGSIVGPFKIRVAGKMAPVNSAASESDRLVLQKFIAVQPDNFLLELNSVRFLQTCSTGKDVHRCLIRVLTHVSLAKPFELTFQRHNHPQAAAKIVPFAARADVQVAQVAQYKKLQEQEAQLSEAVRRKKQFITQQIDYEQEQYLFGHIGAQLFDLYEETMANAQWQAYEFGQALWYYHAPENRLYAEHPMRSSDKTRQLIGTTQLRTRFAVQKMQRVTRIGLRRKRITDAVVDCHLFDRIWGEFWQQAWTKVWTESLLPLYMSSASNSSVEQEVEQLWKNWKNRNLLPVKVDGHVDPVLVYPVVVVNSGPQLADVVKNGIPPSIPPKQKPATPPTVNAEEEKPVVAPSIVSSPATVLVSHPHPDPIDLVEPQVSSVTTANEDEQPADQDPFSEDKPSELHDDTDGENDNDDDDDDEPARWKGYLTLLKTNLKQKKASPPKKHRTQDQSKHTWRGQSEDGVAAKLEAKHPQQIGAYTESEEISSYLPRVACNTGNGADTNSQPAHLNSVSSTSTRLSSSIVPLKARDVVPFMLSSKIQQHYSAFDRDLEDSPSYLSQLLPAHIDPQKTDTRSVLPAPALLKHVDSSFEDVDSWHRSGSFRAFHSFFARNLDGAEDTNNDIRPHEHHTGNHTSVHWEQQASVVINQQHRHHEYSTQALQPVSQFPQRSRQSSITEANSQPTNAPSSLAQQKSFIATDIEILLRQDHSKPHVFKAPVPTSTGPTKLPYIVRRKKNGQR